MTQPLSYAVSVAILALGIGTAANIPKPLHAQIQEYRPQQSEQNAQLWQKLDDQDKRISALEQDAAKMQGAVIGFGALLAIIQGLQLIGFKRGGPGKERQGGS